MATVNKAFSLKLTLVAGQLHPVIQTLAMAYALAVVNCHMTLKCGATGQCQSMLLHELVFCVILKDNKGF